MYLKKKLKNFSDWQKNVRPDLRDAVIGLVVLLLTPVSVVLLLIIVGFLLRTIGITSS